VDEQARDERGNPRRVAFDRGARENSRKKHPQDARPGKARRGPKRPLRTSGALEREGDDGEGCATAPPPRKGTLAPVGYFGYFAFRYTG
jgi:hypothetical protein